LAPGTPWARRVTRGTRLLAGTHSAMWDETSVPDPEDFDATRADDQYRIFGHGPHRCPGKDVMGAQLPTLLAPLLRSDGLRRAAGPAGRLHWDGVVPVRLDVQFGEGG
jgi:cytochrome P450